MCTLIVYYVYTIHALLNILPYNLTGHYRYYSYKAILDKMIFWSQNFRNGARLRGCELRRVEWFSVVAGWEVGSVRDVLAQTE